MKVLVIVGTRPEAIKMAPVVLELQKFSNCTVKLCTTGQHREMLQQAFFDFGIHPDYDLDVMTAKQTLSGLSSILFKKIDKFFCEVNPDWVLLQGDTTTVMVAALCAFYRKIKVGHVEAGLRSFNKQAPFPEEVNRRVAGVVADVHFAPTETSKMNLLNEGISSEDIYVTGNTVVDALLWMKDRASNEGNHFPKSLNEALRKKKKIILVTGHRRENWGDGFESICDAIARFASDHPDAFFVYPVHLNPLVRDVVSQKLGGNPRVLLTDPYSYKPFLQLMGLATIVLTDSGGIQEEATVLGKPVLVMRETTERPEGVKAGAAKLVGTDSDVIYSALQDLLSSNENLMRMTHSARTLYGDGRAAQRIARILGELCGEK